MVAGPLSDTRDDDETADAAIAFELPVYGFPAGLFAVALALAAAYVLSKRIASDLPGELGPQLSRLLDFNGEANLPAFFSTTLWLVAALLAWACAVRLARLGAPHPRMWRVMAVLFLWLALDEAAMIHETLGAAIDARYALPGVLSYGWVLGGIGFFLAVGASFARLLLALRPAHVGRLVLAAAVFVGGALGLEMLGAAVESGSLAGFPTGLSWRRAIALEELLEMAGVILLVHALLQVLADRSTPYRAPRGEQTRRDAVRR